MANKFKTNILTLSGVDISINKSDTTGFLRHDGVFTAPSANGGGITGISGSPLVLGQYSVLGILNDTNNTPNTLVLRNVNGDFWSNEATFKILNVSGDYDGRIILNRGAIGGYATLTIRDRNDGLWSFGLIGDSTDFILNETYPAAQRFTVEDSVGEANANYQLYLSKYANIGILNNNPSYTLDVSGSGNFREGLLLKGVPVVTFTGVTGVGSVTVTTGVNILYISGTAGASSDTASNLGVGYGIFSTKSAGDFKFYSISGSTGTYIQLSGNTLLVSNTSSNSSNPTGTANYLAVYDSVGSLVSSAIISDNRTSIGINNNNPLPEHILDISGVVNITAINENYILEVSGSIDDYTEINIYNKYSGANSSADIVATADFGTANTGYIDMGVNSSRYTGQFVGGSGDAYLYSDAGDLYIGNVVSGKKVYIFCDTPAYQGNQAAIIITNNRYVGVNQTNPQYQLDVLGSGSFDQGINTSNINLQKNPIPNSATRGAANLYIDNYAQRGILSYVNEAGIGKRIQNTFALENIHTFSPNTTTSMNVIGTTATSIGTLSHPTAFADLTGAGYCTSFISSQAGGPAGIQSATTPFFLTSGITGLGAGFFYASQFNLTGTSGYLYGPTITGTQSGWRFFGGMTDAASVPLTNNLPWPTASLLGFQIVRSTGTSGRYDDTYKFVTKNNGATSPMYLADTQCPIVPGENMAIYIYGRNDFRNGIHWMIRRLDRGIIYSGDFTGEMRQLPLVSSAAQRLLKPSIGIQPNSGAYGFKLKGLYCETV